MNFIFEVWRIEKKLSGNKCEMHSTEMLITTAFDLAYGERMPVSVAENTPNELFPSESFPLTFFEKPNSCVYICNRLVSYLK